MKTLSKYITFTKLLSIYFILFTGCSKLEETPISKVVSESVFKSAENLDQTAIAMYAALRGDANWSYGFATAQYMTIMYGADDLTTIPGGNKEPFREYDQFSKQPNNDWMTRLWRGCYRAVINANAILENYQVTVGDEDMINNIVGQAHFIRALSYFYLVRGWGKIPLYTTTYADPAITRSSIADVYELIISDLINAENLLPNNQSDVGRPNKGAAKAFLAKVYLTKAGWPLKDQTNYALAASKAKEVIDNRATYGFGLLDNFASLWLRENDNSRESVFSLQFDNIDGTHANHFIGTASLPNDVYGGWDDYFSELTFYSEFPEGVRKEATFLTKFYRRNGATYDTLDWTEIDAKHPYYAKFLDGGFNPAPPYSHNFYVAAALSLMRYAEVLLIYAEAQAQASGPDESSYDAVNQVRQRAGLEDLPKGLDKIQFVNAVINERGWELAAEGQRWFDLLRTEKITEVVNRRDPDEPVEIVGPVTEDNFYAPIPLEDVLKNPNLAN